MRNGGWAPWALLIVLLVAGVAVAAQTTDPKVPASSPLWWTLTDEITPQELRRIYGDPKDSQRRDLLAVEKGLKRPVSPERLKELLFFQDGSQSPELLPMWEAFDIFASRFGYRWNWEERGPAALREHGISARGVETIVGVSHRHNRRVAALTEEIRDGTHDFLDLQRRAEPVVGEEGLNRALDERDVVTLSVAVGVSVPAVSRLMADWEIDPGAATAEELLPELKAELSAEDWERFRHFLLADVSPRTSCTWWDH